MNPTEKEQIALAGLAAALADSRLDEAERQRLRELIATLGDVDLQSLLRSTLDHRVEPEQLAAALTTPEARRTAYQMAATVVEADGAANDAEAAFLERLRNALGLSEAAAAGLRMEAAAHQSLGQPPVAPAPTSAADVDQLILRHAMLAGAAELLPQGAASMVVLPLQLKLVHAIGARHGVTLARDQVRELLTAFGVGATAQMVERFARSVLGGVARSVGGGLFGAATSAATGVATAFATTYALGHATETYYRQGRSLTTEDLRTLVRRFQDDARTLYPKVEAEIRQQAATLDSKGLLERVRSL